jgi:hypothetical protein
MTAISAQVDEEKVFSRNGKKYSVGMMKIKRR